MSATLSVLTFATVSTNHSVIRRLRFFSLSLRLLVKRRSIAPREGLVFRRAAGGGADASFNFSHSCSTHRTRLRHWLRLV